MNNTADSNNISATQANPKSSNIPVSSHSSKEQEALQIAGAEVVKEVSEEMEIPPEVEKIGVMVRKEIVELPPDVKKLGVTPSGAGQPIATTTSFPQVVLPISDQTVIAGLHAQIVSSLRWLALWCLRKLKKAHLALKVIHGKIIRVRI